MLVIPAGGNQKLLLFESGSLTLTGLRSEALVGPRIRKCVRMISTKLRRVYGPHIEYEVSSPKIKTILSKTRFKRLVSWEQIVRAKLLGVQPRIEEIRNGFTIKRDGVSVNVFEGTGSAIVFGQSLRKMQTVFDEINTDLLHIQKLNNAPSYVDILKHRELVKNYSKRAT